MSYVAKDDKLWQAVQSIVEDEGLVLYDLEKTGRTGIRVVIDRPRDSSVSGQGQQGVTSRDCARLCRRFMNFFVTEGEGFYLTSEPEVEVSSPGINRNLRLPEHFTYALGQRIRIDTLTDQFGKNWSDGELKAIDNEELLIVNKEDDQEYKIRFNDIKRARIDFKF